MHKTDQKNETATTTNQHRREHARSGAPRKHEGSGHTKNKKSALALSRARALEIAARAPGGARQGEGGEREGRRGGGGGGEKAKAGQARPARSPWSPLSPRIPPHPPAAKRSLLVGRRRLAREEEEERREDALLAARHEAVGGALEHRRDLEAALRRDAGRLERAHEAVRDLWFCFVFYGLM